MSSKRYDQLKVALNDLMAWFKRTEPYVHTAFDVGEGEQKTHFTNMVKELHRRSRIIKKWNVFGFIAISIIVGFCVYLFWYSDAIVTNFVGEALKVVVADKAVVLDKLDTINKSQGETDHNKLASENADYFFKLGTGFTSTISRQKSNAVPEVSAAVDAALASKRLSEFSKVVDACINKSEKVEIEVDFKKTYYKSMLDYIAQRITTSGKTLQKLQAEVNALSMECGAFHKANDPKEPVKTDASSLATQAKTIVESSGKLYEYCEKMIAEEKKVLQSITDQRVAYIATQEYAKKTRLEAELRKLDEKEQALERSQANLTSLAWVPSFAVRVGSVVIILFLIQFYVAIYKYNLLTAKFYDSRADVLQIVGKNTLGNWIDTEELLKLCEKYLEKVEFTTPPDPTASFLEAMKLKGK